MKKPTIDFNGLKKNLAIVFQDLLSRKPELEEILLATNPHLRSRFQISNESLKALNDMLAALGPTSPFRNPMDITDYVIERIGEQPIEAILEQIENPWRDYEFSIGLNDKSHLRYEVEIGGPLNLKLSSVHLDTTLFTHTLSGGVKAFSGNDAAEQVENVTRQWLGAARSFGIARVINFIVEDTVPVTLRVHPGIVDAFPTSDLEGILSRVSLGLPSDLTDIESARVEQGDIGKAAERGIRHLVKLFSSHSERAQEVRNAARQFLESLSASEYGASVLYAFVALEALLLEANVKDNVLSRLTEAVAYRIGSSSGHRSELRKDIRMFYDDRSRYVHTGIVRADVRRMERLYEIVGKVLRKEIEVLE